ncbi:shikimate kinase [Flavobacterium sp.]|uniref:shikimate kinase n=1 Tax=Flavobacterium sp. TaxID=239 RepID=UPI003D26C353
MKIVLVGYMGSGKSTIGKMLSENVGIPFYDLDEIIEKQEGMSIKKIFIEKGEVYFRKLEHSVLNVFINTNEDFVLSLGGGTPCYANNHEVLKMSDVASFYLKNSVDTLCERLENEKMSRPLIANFNKEELKEYVNKHLFDRNFYYYQSKYVVECTSKSIEEVVLEIKSILT